MSTRISQPKSKDLAWGRTTQATWLTTFLSLFLTLVSPLWMTSNNITLQHFDSSLSATIAAFRTLGPLTFIHRYFPLPSTFGFTVYNAWVLFQAFLYATLPGKICYGQLTPAGNLLQYTPNGFLAWVITHLVFLCLIMSGKMSPSALAENWEALSVAANAYGLLLAVVVYVKGRKWPSFEEDRKFSGSKVFDFFVGIELNPRIGNSFDLKFFHICRPGMVAWTVIDLSFMAFQFQKHGHISNSMLLLNLLHFIYAADHLMNEDWYLRTIDIGHDHFGFYLAWGSTVCLPSFYTIQAQYLARYPVDLSRTSFSWILVLGLSGYAIFRATNHQKDVVRLTNGECRIFGSPAKYMRCKYKTRDGEARDSLLLCSGWWGISRHANYLGDLLFNFAICATCGFEKILPWTFFFWMVFFLIHRMQRVEQSCQRKYGDGWKKYCEQVRYRLIPGIY